jgi:succinyl-CoA synthetase beta subunit
MKLHEYQSKSLMAQCGIPVPPGAVASTSVEARALAEGMGGRVVVKAQVYAGGRGKGGGIKVCQDPAEVEQAAASLLGTNLVTPQTGPQGAPVNLVLVEEASEIERELYLAIVVDSASRSPVIIASQAGGMEIEEVAEANPEMLLREVVNPTVGFQPYQGRRLGYALGLPNELIRPMADLVTNLYGIFEKNDCSLAEINPLVVTKDGRLLVLDAKLTFDDDAAFRNKELQALRDVTQEDAMEAEATEHNIAYVHLDGDVGCLVNGAGLAMATMDTVHSAGAAPANFLDVGGGADDEKVTRAMSIILADPSVKRVLINVFGGILRCDIVARGVVAACRAQGANPAMVVRMSGTNAEEGRLILEESGLSVVLVDTLKEAADKLSTVVAS